MSNRRGDEPDLTGFKGFLARAMSGLTPRREDLPKSNTPDALAGANYNPAYVREVLATAFVQDTLMNLFGRPDQVSMSGPDKRNPNTVAFVNNMKPGTIKLVDTQNAGASKEDIQSTLSHEMFHVADFRQPRAPEINTLIQDLHKVYQDSGFKDRRSIAPGSFSSFLSGNKADFVYLPTGNNPIEHAAYVSQYALDALRAKHQMDPKEWQTKVDEFDRNFLPGVKLATESFDKALASGEPLAGGETGTPTSQVMNAIKLLFGRR